MAIGAIIPLYSKVEMLGFRGTGGPPTKSPSEGKKFKGFDSVQDLSRPDVQPQKHFINLTKEQKEDLTDVHILSRDNLIRKKENAKRIMKLANDEEFQAQQALDAKKRMEEEMNI
jgi:hypothetical protein